MSPTLIDRPLTVEDYLKHADKYGGLQEVWNAALGNLSASDLLILADQLTKASSWRDRFKLHREVRRGLIEAAKDD